LTESDLPLELGRFRLLSILGAGGMGRVFRAEMKGPERFEKELALKVVKSSVAEKNEPLRRALMREARVGALLKHPNVVDTYDYGEIGGQPYIAMEYVEGIGLDDLLAIEGRLSPAYVLEIGIQMCSGLHYTHERTRDGKALNIVHRDLKPSNVIVSQAGVVKIMDLGVVRSSGLNTPTMSNNAKGTWQYMSPEQAKAEGDLDRRSDLFAVGAILFELATGRRLFHRASWLAVLHAILNVDETLSESGALDELDREFGPLRPVVERCLCKDQRNRYDSARELRAALRSLQVQYPLPRPLEDYIGEVTSREQKDAPHDSLPGDLQLVDTHSIDRRPDSPERSPDDTLDSESDVPDARPIRSGSPRPSPARVADTVPDTGLSANPLRTSTAGSDATRDRSEASAGDSSPIGAARDPDAACVRSRRRRAVAVLAVLLLVVALGLHWVYRAAAIRRATEAFAGAIGNHHHLPLRVGDILLPSADSDEPPRQVWSMAACTSWADPPTPQLEGVSLLCEPRLFTFAGAERARWERHCSSEAREAIEKEQAGLTARRVDAVIHCAAAPRRIVAYRLSDQLTP